MNIAGYIDHTNLKADAARVDIERLCREAAQYKFAAVCVNPFWVAYCKNMLKNKGVKVCAVAGFPLGAGRTESKVLETQKAVEDGADEIDAVINIGAFKSGMADIVAKDIEAVRKVCKGRILKVIIEASLLTDEEKRSVCRLAARAGVDFVKTSTGFAGGATADDVKLMLEAFGGKVKASGGIRTREEALTMIEAGASRIGTSAGVKIVTG